MELSNILSMHFKNVFRLMNLVHTDSFPTAIWPEDVLQSAQQDSNMILSWLAYPLFETLLVLFSSFISSPLVAKLLVLNFANAVDARLFLFLFDFYGSIRLGR